MTLEALEDRTVMSSFTWTGASGVDLNWSTAANWSPAKIPGVKDDVSFAANPANSVVDVDFSVKSINIKNTYKGTVALGADLTLSAGFTEAGGTFQANNHSLTFGTALSITGGVFNAGTGQVVAAGSGTGTMTAASTTFHDVTINRNGDLKASSALNIAGVFDIENVKNLTGTFNLQGDVTTSDTAVGGTGILNINGAGAQKLSAGVDGGQVPAVTIAKTGGSLSLAGDASKSISVSGNWTYVSGGVAAGTSEVVLAGASGKVDTGATSFYDVVINRTGNLDVTKLNVAHNLAITLVGNLNGAAGAISVGGGLASSDAAVGGTANITLVGVNSTITGADFPNGGVVVNLSGGLDASLTKPLDGPLVIQSLGTLTGTLLVGADVTTNDGSIGGAGVVSFSKASSGTQKVFTGHDFDQLPNVAFNGSGTVDLGASKLAIPGNWTFTKGTIKGSTSTVKFIGGGTALASTGTQALNNVIISRTGGLDATGGLIVGGSLVFDAIGSLTGQISTQGDVTTNVASFGGAGVVSFARTSSGVQNVFTGHNFDQLPNVLVASSGTVNLGAANLAIPGNWSYTKGTLTAGTSTVKFVGGGVASLTTGSSRLGNVVISRAGDLTVSGTANIAGSLVLDALNTLTGQVNAQGDVTTNDLAIGGTGVINFQGSAAQTLRAGVDEAQLPNVKITKTGSATLSIAGDSSKTIDVTGNWTYVSGVVAPGTSEVRLIGPGSAIVDTGAGSSFANLVIDRDGNLDTGSGLNVAGVLTINKVATLSGSINASGDVVTNDISLSGAGFITFNGAGAQNLKAGVAGAQVPNIFVKKAAGSVLSLGGGGDSIIDVTGNWFYTSGLVAPGTSTVRFSGGSIATVDTGSQSFGNVVIDRSGNLNIGSHFNIAGDLTINKVLNINGTLGALLVGGDLTSNDGNVGGSANITLTAGDSTITGGDFPNGGIVLAKQAADKVTANLATPLDGTLTINGLGQLIGTLAVAGNVTTSDTTATATSGGVILFAGGSNQKLTAAVDGARVPNVVVNKTGGKLTLAGTIGAAGNWTYTAGAVDGGNSTVSIVGAGDRTIDTGVSGMAFNNVVVDLTSAYALNATNLNVGGDFIVNGGKSIAGTVRLVGAKSTAISAADGNLRGAAIVVAKNLATRAVQLGSNLFNASSVSVNTGRLELGANILSVAGPMTVASGSVLEFTLTSSTQLIVNGNLTFASGSKIDVDGVDTPPPDGSSYNLITVVGSHSLVNNGVLINVPPDYIGTITTGTNGVFKISKNA